MILYNYSESIHQDTDNTDVLVFKVMQEIPTPIVDTSIVEHEEEAVVEEVESEIIDEVVEEEDVKEISEDDAYILAHVINGEAGANYCSNIMRYYVGSVVLNRVNHPAFPNTIKEVVYQPGQYGCVIDGNYDLEPSSNCYEIAYNLLRNGSQLPENVVYQSTNKLGSGVYCKEQNMYFCYR